MKIDDPTYEQTIRRHWAVPGAHERQFTGLCLPPRHVACDGSRACNQGRCPHAEEMEQEHANSAPGSGLGFKIAGCVLTAVIVGWAIAAVFA